MMTIEPTAKEQTFIQAYFEAVDFTETGEMDQPEKGTELDTDFFRESVIDCLAFYSRIACYISDDNIEQAGHDFWLTRNGHGAGFWDRPKLYGDYKAVQFTKWAESMGSVDALYEITGE
jgi:hypothetical protein